MVHFIIAGIFDCEHYIHVCYVAEYLAKKLPNIEVTKIPKDPYDWENWLQTINMKHKWHHKRSPLIYKELSNFGARKHFIGGISEFWEYCYDYYGLESLLTSEELEALKKDHLMFYGKDHLPTLDEEKTNILIYGPKTRYLWLLLGELFQIEGLAKAGGLQFKFYTDSSGVMGDPDRDFEDVISFLRNEYNTESAAVNSIFEAVDNCEFIIITEHWYEDPEKGYLTLHYEIAQLADLINDEKKAVKVLFANFGLSCYPATILARDLERPNIAVVTSDKGLGPLKVLSGKLNLDLGHLSGPPVWGFIGNDKIIDLLSVVKKCDVLKPFERAVKGKEDSSLAQGAVETELRFIEYAVDDLQGIWSEIRKRKRILKEKLGRAAVYSKVNATVNIIKLWFSPNEPDEIVSLGVMSDGSFGVSSELVFSQPAILENKKWRPFSEFPVSADIQSRIDKSVEDALKLLYV